MGNISKGQENMFYQILECRERVFFRDLCHKSLINVMRLYYTRWLYDSNRKGKGW